MEETIDYVEDHYKITSIKQTPISPYQQTANGYGGKLKTSYMIKLDNGYRWYRVYCMCYSNSGSIYIQSKGKILFLRERSLN